MICTVAAGLPQQKVGVVCISDIIFVSFCYVGLFISRYRSFQDAGNRDEGQLQKTELKLSEVVIGTMFRPLYYAYGIVQPNTLLSFGFSVFFLIFSPVGKVWQLAVARE